VDPSAEPLPVMPAGFGHPACAHGTRLPGNRGMDCSLAAAARPVVQQLLMNAGLGEYRGSTGLPFRLPLRGEAWLHRPRILHGPWQAVANGPMLPEALSPYNRLVDCVWMRMVGRPPVGAEVADPVTGLFYGMRRLRVPEEGTSPFALNYCSPSTVCPQLIALT
jgi:hypothetical protein